MPIKPVSGEIKSQEINDNLSYLESLVLQANGGPIDEVSSVSELNSKYPNGANGVVLVDGVVYLWNGNSWFTNGTIYQNQGLSDNSIDTEKYKDKSLRYRKQNLYDVQSKKLSFRKTNLWVDLDSSRMVSNENYRSYLIPVNRDMTYKLELKGNHNRFSVMLVDNPEISSMGEYVWQHSSTIFPETQDFIVNSGRYEYILLGYINNELPDPVVDNTSFQVEELDSKIVQKFEHEEEVSHLSSRAWWNYETNEFGQFPNNRSIIVPINRNTEIFIETKGQHDRFVVATTNVSGLGFTNRVFNLKVVENPSIGNVKYSFQNYEDDYLYLGLSSGQASSEMPRSVIVTQNIPSNISKRDIVAESKKVHGISDKNILFEPTFSQNNSLSKWISNDANVEFENGIASLTKNIGKNSSSIYQNFIRQANHKYYYMALVKSESPDTFTFSRDEKATSHSGNGEYELLTHITNVTSSETVNFGVMSKDDLNRPVFIKGMAILDLTSIFGIGKEPSAESLDGYFKYMPFPGDKNDMLIDGEIEGMQNLLLEKNVGNERGIEKYTAVYPVLWAVKMDNSRSDDIPRPVGYLYYDPIAPHDIYYSEGRPDNLKKIATWDRSVSYLNRGPGWYRAAITKDGDIICVFRGDEMGMGANVTGGRQNPIIFNHTDLTKPREIQIEGTKPTGWLQNCGVDFLTKENMLIFAEYTRPSHQTCNIWKVTAPFDNPENWKIKKTFELSGSNTVGMKHLHQIDYDPFSGYVYSSTGDDDSAAKILVSKDLGETWDVIFEGQRKYARVLNFVFLEDCAYWANDDMLHGFYRADRDEHGEVDFNNIVELVDLTGHPPTYANIYHEATNSIIILNRHDITNDFSELPILCYSIDENEMYTIGSVENATSTDREYGFRMESFTAYPSKSTSEVAIGFGVRPLNYTNLLRNTGSTVFEELINNYILDVIDTRSGLKLKAKTVSLSK